MPGAVNVALRWARPGGGPSFIAAGIGSAVAVGLPTGITSSAGPSLISAGAGNALAVGQTASVNNSGGPSLTTAPSISVWRAA